MAGVGRGDKHGFSEVAWKIAVEGWPGNRVPLKNRQMEITEESGTSRKQTLRTLTGDDVLSCARGISKFNANLMMKSGEIRDKSRRDRRNLPPGRRARPPAASSPKKVAACKL